MKTSISITFGHSSVNRRARLALLGLCFVLALGACAPIEPWVKPYERENLADPIMAFDRNPVSSSYLDHVFESREGARGAVGSAGGGCGCN
jgi:hypothetical protein